MIHPSNSATGALSHRERLLTAMAQGIVEAGYEDLAVSDVVRIAKVSKRTFYDHFADKESCLLAFYDEGTAHVVSALSEAMTGLPPGVDRVRAGVARYLAELQAEPAILNAALLVVWQTGARGLAVRRAAHHRYEAVLLQELVGADGEPLIGSTLATALVGGINELILDAVERNLGEQLTALTDAIMELLTPYCAV